MATDIKYIKHLLEKFYEGTTSPEEDNILYEFFSSTSEIPEEMEADSKIFTALSDSSKYAVPPSDLHDRIMKGGTMEPLDAIRLFGEKLRFSEQKR